VSGVYGNHALQPLQGGWAPPSGETQEEDAISLRTEPPLFVCGLKFRLWGKERKSMTGFLKASWMIYV
jgi:hypothetical protein